MESLFIGGGFWRFGTDCTCQEFGGFWKKWYFTPSSVTTHVEQVEWKRCLRGNPCSNHAAFTGYSGTWMEQPPQNGRVYFYRKWLLGLSTFQNYLCPAVLQGLKEITIKFPHHKIKHGYHCVYIYRCELNFGISSKKRFLKVSAELDLRDKDESLGMATKPL